MNPETLNFWANVAAIYLILLLFLFIMVTGVLFGFLWWYLRKGRRALALPFLYAQVYALRVQRTTQKVSDQVVRAPIALSAATEQVTTTSRALVRGRSENKK